jgi:hypothetical protein
MSINATANPIQPTAGQPALLRLPNLRQLWSFRKRVTGAFERIMLSQRCCYLWVPRSIGRKRFSHARLPARSHELWPHYSAMIRWRYDLPGSPSYSLPKRTRPAELPARSLASAFLDAFKVLTRMAFG